MSRRTDGADRLGDPDRTRLDQVRAEVDALLDERSAVLAQAELRHELALGFDLIPAP